MDINLKYSEGSWTIMMLETNFLDWNVYFWRYGNACVCLETTNLTNLKMHIFPVGEMITHGESFSLTQSRHFLGNITRMWVGRPGTEHSVNGLVEIYDENENCIVVTP